MATLTDLARESGLKRDQLEGFLSLVVRHLQRGEPVKIVGFGTFHRRLRKAGVVRTPTIQNGEPIEYPEQYTVHFHVSPIAKRQINAPPKPKKKARKKAAKKR